MSDIFWAACGLLLIFEGLLPFLMPDVTKKTWGEMSKLPASQLRIFGFACMMVGLIVLYLSKPA